MNVALISDIHFGKSSRTKELAVEGDQIKDETVGGKSLVDGLINLFKEKEVKYLFIAGDLTSEGSPQEFSYCQNKILEIAEKSNISTKNIICGLGNHDIDWKITRLSDAEDIKYSDEIKKIIENGYQLIASNAAVHLLDNTFQPPNKGPAPFSGVFECEDFISIVLNTVWCCNHSDKIPHGQLSDDQLKWFENIAQKYDEDPRIKILLMHHHPFNYSYPNTSLDTSAIKEGSELQNIAGKYGINMVMHGHRHHPIAITRKENGWKVPIVFMCAGSLSVNTEQRNFGDIPNTVHIINLDKAPSYFILYNYKYTSTEGWQPITVYSRSTPLEEEMWLGRIVDDAEINAEILKYQEGNVELRWDELPEVLKCISNTKLNQKFKEILKGKKIFGEFPNDVYIL